MSVLVLDGRGQRCPLPILLLARHITDVEIGDEVMIDADDPAAAGDIAAWCRMRGQEHLGVSRAADGTPRYAVRRLR